MRAPIGLASSAARIAGSARALAASIAAAPTFAAGRPRRATPPCPRRRRDRTPPPGARPRGTRARRRCRTGAPRPRPGSPARRTGRATRAHGVCGATARPIGASSAATPGGSAGNSSPISATVGIGLRHLRRARHRALLGLGPGVAQHGAGQHVLRLGMGRHAETRHVDADHPHAVDLLGQPVQRHAGRGRHAQVDHHDGVVVGGLGESRRPRRGCPRTTGRLTSVSELNGT